MQVGPRSNSRRYTAMGQEVSNQVDDSVPPQTLHDRSIEAVAQLILEGKARRIIALTGAGISTSAGSESCLPVRFSASLLVY